MCIAMLSYFKKDGKWYIPSLLTTNMKPTNQNTSYHWPTQNSQTSKHLTSMEQYLCNAHRYHQIKAPRGATLGNWTCNKLLGGLQHNNWGYCYSTINIPQDSLWVTGANLLAPPQQRYVNSMHSNLTSDKLLRNIGSYNSL
jgi:hypothetical protein